MTSDYMHNTAPGFALARILLWVLYAPLTLYQGPMKFLSTFPLPHDQSTRKCFALRHIMVGDHTRLFDELSFILLSAAPQDADALVTTTDRAEHASRLIVSDG